ncbi:3'-5' exonuclease [Micrococcus lylae]|uniref:3'-5' exonuclease n=1 Tax=Micrococcus lylae TaxID=1273 RepID=UPI001CA5DA31|nr:3'-5' exonuclease [Micrococcus lylae]WIK82254.1 3'-5' exonuclease [Micrococcus lylae]
MNSVIMSKMELPADPAVKMKALAFLDKLTKDDTLPGLHIEPIKGSADSHIRTGRVDRGYRAVLFKLTEGGAVTYVFHGVYEHDKANHLAERAVLKTNPVNGVTEVRYVEPAPLADWEKEHAEYEAMARREAEKAAAEGAQAEAPEQAEETVAAEAAESAQAEAPEQAEEAAVVGKPAEPGVPAEPLLTRHGVDAAALAQLGVDEALAARAVQAPTEEELLAVAEDAEAEWQELVLIALGSGQGIDEVRREFGLDAAVDTTGTEEQRILRGLQHPAALVTYTWIEDDEELRRVVEDGDFSAWRVFLHPLQKEFVERDYNGPAKLAGGAGTGKTVVLLHRARRLAAENPEARILLTTFTRNLADALRRDLAKLDPTVPIAKQLGEPGVHVTGVDALVRAVAMKAGRDVGAATGTVLGAEGYDLSDRRDAKAWSEAVDAAGGDLPAEVANETFMAAEYAMVVLPKRVRTVEDYVRVPRRGRGTALNRKQRLQVWKVIEKYRAAGRAKGALDFEEMAAVSAAYAQQRAEGGGGRFFDHVLVDEGQDLTPAKWQFLRVMVEPGRNDMFLAEDTHQRIYGQKVTLSHYGIESRGRSRRLTLNYRTTQQNLGWAMKVLDGGEFEDLDGEAESHTEYRSARSGPKPVVLAARSFAEELDAAADLIAKWSRQPGVKLETIAVLVRTKPTLTKVVTGLAERGVKIRAVEQESVRAGAVVGMTMHRAKGTEFSHVLLMDVRDGALPVGMRKANFSEADLDDALLRERSLLYVAATRARDVLAVSYHGARSPLLG